MKQLFYYLLFVGYFLSAQNLVPNPSFETIDESTLTPWGINYGANGLLESAVPWFSPKEECTSDLYDGANPINYDCSSLCRTQSISVRIAIFDDFNTANNFSPNFDTPREYIEVELSDTLIPEQEYIISLYLNIAGCSSMHNGLGVYLSSDSVLFNNVDFLQTPWDFSLSPLEAQVELSETELMPNNEWFHFEKIYLAIGGERFITIGNFKTDEQVNFITDSINCFGCEGGWMALDLIFLDDIAVYPVGTFQDVAHAGNDTLICSGTNVVLGSHDYENYLYTWSDSLGNEWATGTIDVSPSITTIYYLSVKDFAFYETFDSVTIIVDDCINYSANAGLDTTICIGASIILEDEYYPTYDYQWTSDDGGLWDDWSIEVSPTVNTAYYLEVIDDMGTTYDTVYVSVQQCENAIAEAISTRIKIHPNPASTRVHIESPYTISSWKVLDAVGKEVLSTKYKVQCNFTIDVSSLDTGLYFLELEVDGIQFVKHLLID
jgi:hypothetical protein